MDFIESCRRFIALDSTPSQGNLAAAKFVVDFCKKRGFYVETMEEVWGDQKQMNIIVRPVAGRPQNEFMLQTHIDTPDPGPFALWSETGHNPFDAHIIDKKIYGLGAADVKLDLLCKMEALSTFDRDTKWKIPPVIVGTYGEETGMMGALKLIRKNKITAKKALIGEPSNLSLITSGKGIAAVEIRIPFGEDENTYRIEHNLRESTSTQSRIFNGKAAHSSMPQLGDSAIKKMLNYLLQLPEDITVMEIDGGVNFNTVPANAFLELDFVSGHQQPMAKKIAKIYRGICDLEDEFLQYQDEDFNPAHPTLNIGIIRTQEDHVFISGNCRIPPLITNEIYERWMRQLEKTCESVGGNFIVTDYKRPFKSNEESGFAKNCLEALRQAGIEEKMTTQSSTNEASLFSRIGIECICFGPGRREGNIHTPQEHVMIEDLNRAIHFYKNAIEKVCL